MYEKCIDFFVLLLSWSQLNMTFLINVLLASFISFIREWRKCCDFEQSVIESISCGVITIGTINTLNIIIMQINFTHDLLIPSEIWGGIIGFLGTKKISQIVDVFLFLIKNRYIIKK